MDESGATAKFSAVTEDTAPAPADTDEDPVRFDSAGNVQVYIHLENTEDATLQQLRDLGVDIEITNSDVNIVQAWVPPSALDEIAALESVQEITPPDYGFTKAGRVTTEGDGIHRADLVRAFSGITGQGVKVGVISDGVDAWRTISGRDLPSSIDIDPDLPGSGDEGTALLEIIHDLAPGAELAFSGPRTSLGMVNAILWLANDAFDGEGADVIVDDLGYYTEPYFEDGPVALAAADAVAGGAVFASSAGNSANGHYSGAFSDDSNGYHDFDNSAETDIALRVRLGTQLFLQWNDQFGASGNDYDLFVCPPGLKPVKFNLQNGVCRGSNSEQDGDDDPYESLFTLFSGLSTADVYIRKYSGDSRQLKLFVHRGRVLEHGVTVGTLIGHEAVPGLLSVGAIDASDPGNDEAQSYSDRGPVEIYFPSRETRQKPDLMGIDGVLVTGAGGFGQEVEGSSFRRFFGTSAAAPHVAGIAALAIEAQRKADPSMTKKAVADAVTQKLRDTATDLGETGHDNIFGYGRADAWAALTDLADISTTDALELYSLATYAETHTVNSTGDGADADTTDGVCDDGTVDGSVNCTLRAAIQQTNAGAGAVIEFNISGSSTTIQPASALPAITKPVFIDGYSQPGASPGTVLIELDGANAGNNVDGLTLSGGNSYIRGIAVNNFARRGMVVQNSSRYILEGNLIGTDTTGSTDEGNGHWGVYLLRVSDALLKDNVISGNNSHGVLTSIGGRLHFYGNKIGTNAGGDADLGNTLAGVHISSRSVIVRDNVISGNDSHGIHLDSNVTENVVIEYNRIGTNDDGDTALANTGTGIYFDGDPKYNLVAKNIISGNGSHGVWLHNAYVRDNLIAENWVGTNSSATDLGNGGSRVHFSQGPAGGPDDNTVERNVIAYNGSDGVTITGSSSLGNTIWKNSIHDNDGEGIDLGGDGPTANDTSDSDSGPNHLQNYPGDITFATWTNGEVASVRFTQYAMAAGRQYLVNFYACDSATSGEGKTWLGFVRANPSASGLLSFSVSTLRGQITRYTAPDSTAQITATATDTETGSTSEFAPCVAQADLPELVISVDSLTTTEDASTATTYTVSLSSPPAEDLTVKLSVGDSSVATISPTETTFTSIDYSETITVTPISDDDADNEATTINHFVSINGNDYITAIIPVEVTDDDAPALTLLSDHATADFPTDASVGHYFDGFFGTDEENRFREGTTATYTLQLFEEPEGDTTIDLSSSGTGALTFSPTSITFTKTGNEDLAAMKYQWDSPQVVTLTAEMDSDAGIEIETVSHRTTVSGQRYVVGQVRAFIQDTGLPLLTFSPDTREVSVGSEGGSATYTLVMAREPDSDVIVSLSSSDSDSVTVLPRSITFTKTGEASDPDKYEWDDTQTVTVTGVPDNDEFDDRAFIRHRTTFDGELASWPSVQVTVTDGNRAPFFEDGLNATRELPEDATQGAGVGNPVAATDLNAGDTLTYTLDDPSGLFEIDGNGQISVIVTDPPVTQPFDFETGTREYLMDLVVRDSGTLEDKIDVKVLVTNVNEAPSITRTAGDDTLSYPENTAITRVLRRYSATDPDAGTSFTWSVGGTHADDFTIDSTGNLRFASPPDHEAGATRSITIVATDNGVPALRSELPITVSVTDVDEPPVITQTSPVAPYVENVGFPAAMYSATDPEGAASTFTWSLGGTDSGDFDISSNGQLTFKSTPDFERPADSGGNNVYNVQVRANDGSLTGTLDAVITVTDVNEPPVVTGDAALSLPENTATTRVLDRYAATDPERRPVTWTVAGTDADAFRIDSSGNLYFDGTPDHETPTDSGGDNVYDIQVVATDDGNLGDETASSEGTLEGSLDVIVTVTPIDEPPSITGDTTIDDFDENGTGSVAAFTATDPEGDTNITWSLGGTDRGDFDITGGVLTFKNAPDHEQPADSGGNNHYEVTVEATDSNNNKGALHVDVIVKDVDEPPIITGSDTVDDFPENSVASRQVARYTATDPEGATVILSLTGTDSDDFNLAGNGSLTFRESPDYEEQTTYTFTVRAVAGTHTVNKPVNVNIRNLEEPGAIALSAIQPQENISLAAVLTDDDGPSGTTWQWYRTSSRGSTGTAITGETSSSYSPINDDVGFYLRVIATYDDGFDPGNTAQAVSSNRVLAVNPANVRPAFPATGDYSRSIRENLAPRTSVGAPVRATDANNDRLTYSISASDLFEIDRSSGQLRTTVPLDHEDDDEHTITVTATDPGDLDTTIDVTITVENADETPLISGPATVEVAENGGTAVATYTVTDPDETGVDWALPGTDDDAFNLSSGGVLTFINVPDYEEKSSYSITLEARERSPGNSVARQSVTVRITNVDEDGTVTVPVSEPRVGQQLTPKVEDPDGAVSAVEWKWERRDPGGNWSPIPQGTRQSYTPTRDDNGKELRVTVIYRDRQGPGKTETHTFGNAVVLRPYFPADTDTRTIRENTAETQNVGSRFTARHPDSVNLTYTLGGTDARHFTIDDTTGQLKTSNIPLDYEALTDHQAEVTVTATAPDGETSTITVTVAVTNECISSGEPPCAPGKPRRIIGVRHQPACHLVHPGNALRPDRDRLRTAIPRVGHSELEF